MYTSRFDDAQIAFVEAMKRYKPFAELVHMIEVNVPMVIAVIVSSIQSSTMCKGLPLSSYMLYPIQRIPRYRLLLEGIFIILMMTDVTFFGRL